MSLKQKDIIWRLAQLSSLPFQERYILNADADEYILAVELLENVEGLRHRLANGENHGLLTDPQHAALARLFAMIVAKSDEALKEYPSRDDAALHILQSAIWQDLRLASREALVTFGYDKELTLDDVEKLSN